ncbi:MAG: hypothetical protein QOH69_734, partial [Actinomycetota bacterium]|nr:hypothetical protein [Actinomycetota bacterium]
AELLADDIIADDRRRVVNAGIRRGRDVHIADNRVVVEVSAPTLSSNVIATRSERLALAHVRIVNRGMSGEVGAEVLGIAEIDADERIVALVTFDPDDIDAAYEELEARYLAGEAAAHAHTWSVIAETFAGLNRHEPPQTTPDWVEVDRRRITATAPGDLIASLRASWDLMPDFAVRIETVHRLTDLGAVITETARGTSQDGFAAEWRDIVVQTVEGNLTNRCEIFDEADLDVSLARFEELSWPALRLENAVSQVSERFWSYYTARDWDAMAAMLGDNFSSDDRRRVVNAGVQHGRDNQIADMRALAEVEANVTVAAVATRGERLVLTRVCSSNRDLRHGEFGVEMLAIAEIDGDNRIAATVLFDADDIDAAFDELDARYLAGEAADFAHTWSAVSDAYAAFNRHELPAEDLVTVDRRRATPFESSTMTETLRSIWDLTPDLNIRIEAVCRLSSCGAVVTHVQHGTSTEGFDAEWRSIELMTVDGDRINYCEIFDEADLDAALARFEELQTQARRPRNAASQLIERFQTYFAARNWAAIADISAEEIFTDDRRSVVSSGILRGRDVDLANIRATADLGATGLTSTVIATRGERIALARLGLSGRDQRPEAFRSEMLGIVEIDAGNRFAARILFDLNDFDAAIAELDARYLAGETAAHANTWSVIAAAHAGFNRQELPATTPDPVYIDHRPLVSIEGADLAASLRAVWDITPASSVYIEAVHRLDKLGAVATQVLKGTSQEGLDAEWRMIDIFTVEGNLYSRVEVFDETDLDAALARFEELHPQAPRLDSAATQVDQRFWTYFEARDWDAMARLLAAEIASDDRRRVVNTGVLHGRDVQIANLRALAGLGVANITSTSIATRGERLALTGVSSSNRDLRHGEFRLDGLNIIEIDADNRVAAGVLFDLDDIDAAFEELDARYLAGEAAVHSHTWSVIARECAAFNRHELPTADWVTIDHRRPIDSIDSSDLHANIRATWDLMPDISIHIEAAHRLSGFGAVVTYAAHGTSSKGFDADWRMIQLLTVEGDLINRCEIFDEADLDAALARFEELHHQASHPENAASQVVERFWKYFAARDWDAMAETIADDFWTHDRRRVVNAGVLRGRAVHITDMRAVAELGFGGLTSTVIATRGHRSALIRIRSSMRGAPPGEVTAEMLSIVEIDADNRLAAAVLFDSDDIDAAFEELDAIYLAHEAVGHARTWSVIARAYAAVNRHEVPATTPDWTMVDHRPIATFEARDLTAFLDATWALTAQANIYIEAVHRLSDLGAIVTHASQATSQEGLDAEWHDINLVTVDEDLVDSCEIFDEADLDAALARFEELHPATPRLENAASQVEQRFLTYFAARDWDAYAEILSDDVCMDDRRHVVNAGVRHGRDAEIASQRAVADVGVTHFTSTVIAIRGRRLALGCYSVFDGWSGSKVLCVSEINAENQIVARVAFDSDDVDAAFEELDARFLAGEAAAHAHIWTAMTQVQAAYNRHELPPATADGVNIDHRRGRAFAPGD